MKLSASRRDAKQKRFVFPVFRLDYGLGWKLYWYIYIFLKIMELNVEYMFPYTHW